MGLLESVGCYEQQLRAVWGDQFIAWLRYVQFATLGSLAGLARFRMAVEMAPKTKTLIVIGTRYGAMADLQFEAAASAANILMPYDRGVNEGHATTRLFQILISGGCWGVEELFDDRPGLLLLDDFRKQFGNRFDPWLSVDQMSQNTGHQALLIGRLAAAPLNFRRVVMVLPIDHIARFGATIAFELKRLGLLEDNSRNQLFFLPAGTWDMPTRHGRFSMHEEAFAPKQKDGDPRLIASWRPLGGELAERWEAEQNPDKNGKFACGALSPTEMCQRLRLF